MIGSKIMSTYVPNVRIVIRRWRTPPVTYVEFRAATVVILAVGVPE